LQIPGQVIREWKLLGKFRILAMKLRTLLAYARRLAGRNDTSRSIAIMELKKIFLFPHRLFTMLGGILNPDAFLHQKMAKQILLL
jgi:hypothetical protein